MASRFLFAGLLVCAPAIGLAASPKMHTVSYAVADLVVPLDAPGKGRVETTEAELIRVIESTVAPASWQGAGGAGVIEYFPLTMSLVVRQTPDVQEQVQDLMASLRRLQDCQIAVEVRFVRVPYTAIERLGLFAEEDVLTGVTTLDDAKLRALLEKVQGDPRASVMQAPKMTMFNGQKANLELTEQHVERVGVDFEKQPVTEKVKVGLEMSVLPTMSADHQKVTVQLSLKNSWAVPPAGCCSNQPRVSTTKVEKTLKLARGTTAMFMGWSQMSEVCHEAPLPVVSRIPYVNRLFKTVSYECEQEVTFVLVTPRVVHSEPRQTGGTGASEEAEQQASSDPPEQREGEIPRKEAVAQVEKPAEKLKFVNKREFELCYELANVGPSKLESLAVWVTRDGEKWERYPGAVKPTGSVPITVKVDGLFGFVLVPRNVAGVDGPTPKAGDKPQALVVVRTAPPRVMFFSSPFDPVEQPAVLASRPTVQTDGTVEIGYRALDDNHLLREKPVSVYWSERSIGPWHPIEENLDATGKVSAKPGSLPSRCYFRVTAADVAGNVGEAITPEPVVTDTNVPTVRNVKVKLR